jgi:ribonucleoside-diphosphate reductase alpha chain
MSTQSTTTDRVRSILDRARLDSGAVLTDETVETLRGEVERNLYTGADREEIYEAVLQSLTARIERAPEYKRVAGRVFRQRYYETVIGEDLQGQALDDAYREIFVENIRRGVELDLLDERMVERFDLDGLAEVLVPDREEQFEYMAMETLTQRYFLTTTDGEPLELPQAF